MHSGTYFIGVAERQANDAGAGAAEETADCACAHTGFDDPIELRHQFEPVWLMKSVVENAGERFLILRGESSHDQRRTIQRVGSIRAREFFWHELAGRAGAHLEFRDECHGLESRINIETQAVRLVAHDARDRKTPQNGGRSIVGMAFKPGNEMEEGVSCQVLVG